MAGDIEPQTRFRVCLKQPGAFVACKRPCPLTFERSDQIFLAERRVIGNELFGEGVEQLPIVVARIAVDSYFRVVV